MVQYCPWLPASHRFWLLQEGDPEGWWEETFKGHVDSKPRGPEAISFDLEFPDTQHVYGLPEHATSLSLNPTVDLGGYCLLGCN